MQNKIIFLIYMPYVWDAGIDFLSLKGQKHKVLIFFFKGKNWAYTELACWHLPATGAGRETEQRQSVVTPGLMRAGSFLWELHLARVHVPSPGNHKIIRIFHNLD